MTDQNLIRELQEALFFWMPSIAGQDGPDGERAENDSMLLMGWNGGNDTSCYGDRMLATIDALKKARNESLLDAERAREERNREHVRLNAEWMAKCKELRKDALRYRWLKDNSEIIFNRPAGFIPRGSKEMIYTSMPSIFEMDIAIDSELAKKEGA